MTALERVPADSTANLHFLNLKSVFCKSRANHGIRVRFSWKRLCNVINAAIQHEDTQGLVEKQIPEQSLPANCDWNEFDGKLCCESDPTVAVGDIACWLTQARRLKKAEFQIRNLENGAKIIFTLSQGLAPEGGLDFNLLEKAFCSAGIEKKTFDTSVYGKSKIEITLNTVITDLGNGVKTLKIKTALTT